MLITLKGLTIWALRVAVGIVLMAITFVLVRAFDSRRKPDLRPWHSQPPEEEFHAPLMGPEPTFREYLDQEERLFQELEDYLFLPSESPHESKYSRYSKNGRNNPCNFPVNWNRTLELEPEEVRGGVLLVHGLTDSPYSMRTLAEMYRERGYYVVAMRMPGHGTVPAGLIDFRWQDCRAAVRIGAKRVRAKIAPDQPFHIVGYSNGGALAMLYTLESVDEEEFRTPDRVILFSPAMGVRSIARTSTWHKALSWIPYFEKSKWYIINPEYDPYKYNSFSQNAAAQTWALTREVQRKIARLKKAGKVESLPPILTFQSVVDATIIRESILRFLYDDLPVKGSELVVFDVNHFSNLEGLFASDYAGILEALESNPDLPYRFTVITNRNRDTRLVMERISAPFSSRVETRDLELEWPAQVYSLAHVSIPFPPDDPVYGGETGEASGEHLQIGQLALRGEKNILIVPTDHLMRLRYNPFHAYMMEKIGSAIDADSQRRETK